MFYPDFENSFKQALETIQGKRVAIIGHQRPDGDCVGSQIGLCRALNSFGCDAIAVTLDPTPKNLIPFIQDTPFKNAEEVEDLSERICITVDCGDATRIGMNFKSSFDEILLNLDHHLSNDKFAKINIVDSSSAATAEILAGIFIDHNLEIDPITANALFVAINTDTGSFNFPSTSQRTFKIASQLIEKGAKPSEVNFILNENQPFERLMLLKKFLYSLRLELENQVCIGLLTENSYKETNTSPEDAEGFVNYTRTIKDVKVGALIDKKANHLKLSLRAKDPAIRLDLFAKKFNGGGHACAAGIRVSETLEDFYPKFLDTLKEHLDTINKESA